MSALSLEGVGRDYSTGRTKVRAVVDVSLSVEQGETVAITGPSGSGKTSLLLLCGGLERPTTGRVRHGEQDLAQLSPSALTAHRRRHVGFVFQDFQLMPALTALQNVALPLLLDGHSRREAHRRARDLLDSVGIGDRLGHLPARLSGGEQQRVCVARAVANRPSLVLADEPTGNLDRASGDRTLKMLLGAAREEGAALVIVTHDLRAAAAAERRLELVDGRCRDVRSTDAPARQGQPA
jgi:predicted ABC-type transport system involved in lysophospholipase L1 biosynthesis ATPase subunit